MKQELLILILISVFAIGVIQASEHPQIVSSSKLETLANGDLLNLVQAKSPGDISTTEFRRMQELLLNTSSRCMQAKRDNEEIDATCLALWRALHL